MSLYLGNKIIDNLLCAVDVDVDLPGNLVNQVDITCSYNNLTKTWKGKSVVFNIPARTNYTLSFGSAIGYITPSSINLTLNYTYFKLDITYNRLIISFSLQSETTTYNTYSAYYGMTMEEWIDSDFNTDGWYISGSYIRYDISSSRYVIIEILDITSGTQYAGTITSTSTCCFVAGTQVLTSLDGECKNIEDIIVGDEIVSYNEDTGENITQKVTAVIENHNSLNMAKLTFDDGEILEMTDYHPLYTLNGWRSLTDSTYDVLCLHDMIKTVDGWSELIDINMYTLESPIITYTLSVSNQKKITTTTAIGNLFTTTTIQYHTDVQHNYLANRRVVHNFECDDLVGHV